MNTDDILHSIFSETVAQISAALGGAHVSIYFTAAGYIGGDTVTGVHICSEGASSKAECLSVCAEQAKAMTPDGIRERRIAELRAELSRLEEAAWAT